MQKKIKSLFSGLIRTLDVFHRDIQEDIKKFAESLNKGSLLLDAGSGEGKYKAYFKHCNVIGVDKCIGDPNWDYSSVDVVGDLHSLPFKDNVFDAIICVVVFEHLRNPFRAMKELSRVLKKGGKIFIVFPFNWEIHQAPHDYFRFTEYGFKAMAEDSGLEIVSMEKKGCLFRVFHYQVASLIKSYNKSFVNFLVVLLFLPFFAIFMLVSGFIDRLTQICNYTPGYTTILKKR